MFLEPETQVDIEGSSPFFVSIRENQQAAALESQELISSFESPETRQSPPIFAPPPFLPDTKAQEETKQTSPIFNNLQDLIQSFKKEPKPIAPTVIPDDSFDKFQKISSMMGAILSDAGIGGEAPKEEAEEMAESEESAEDEEEGSQRAAIIPGPAQWPLVAFSFENAFLRA